MRKYTPYKDLPEEKKQRLREASKMYCRRLRATDPAYMEAQRRYMSEMRQGTPREKTVEEYLRSRVEANGGMCPKFSGVRGAPDRLVILPGCPTYFVELKTRLGRVADAQARYHERLRQLGQKVWVLNSREEVDAFMTEISA